MNLSVRTYKIRKSDNCPVYNTKRFACFDTVADGDTFIEKFNNAMNVLKEEIEQDKMNNDMNIYEPIVIADVFVSSERRIEKQKAKKPIPPEINEDFAFCPSCKRIVYDIYNYCPGCGQKLDWSDDEE